VERIEILTMAPRIRNMGNIRSKFLDLECVRKFLLHLSSFPNKRILSEILSLFTSYLLDNFVYISTNYTAFKYFLVEYYFPFLSTRQKNHLASNPIRIFFLLESKIPKIGKSININVIFRFFFCWYVVTFKSYREYPRMLQLFCAD
jgi:hypothetical protein